MCDYCGSECSDWDCPGPMMDQIRALEVAVELLNSREVAMNDLSCEFHRPAEALSILAKKMALEGSKGGSSDFCAVPGCGCSEGK